jgi:hypothetical protein
LPIARPVQRLLLAVVACLLAATAGTLSAPPASAGGDQLQASGVATYRLDPARRVIHVTTVYTLVNRAPGRRSTFDCSFWSVTWSGATYVPRTCTRRTGQSFTRYRFWIEKDATAVRVRASSGSARARRGSISAGYRRWTATVSPIRYGQTRRLTVTYELPGAGPRPAAGSVRRVSYGYADFCVSGPTSDTGQTRVVVPSGYALATTPSLESSAAGSARVYGSGRMAARPWEFGLCLRGPNPAGSVQTPVPGPGGATVAVGAWRDDERWLGAVTAAIGGELVALEGVLGTPAGPLPTSISETTADTADAAPAGAGAWALAEWVTDPAAISTPLALGVWLPQATFGDGWVRDGTLEWARTAAGLGGTTCDEPLGAPDATPEALDLDSWVAPEAGGSSPAADAIWAYKRQVACFIVSEVARQANPARMRAALDAIRDGWDAWSPADAPVQRAQTAIGWRDWVDIVTERALVPAGADPDLAADLIATYDTGIDPSELAAHKAARYAYHRHLDRYGSVPASVTDAMRRWAFEAAQAGLAAADQAAASAASVGDILPGVDTDGGPVDAAIRAAQTQSDLEAAVRLAASQVDIAREVAAAFALEAAPRDALQELGLAGMPAVHHSIALDAVERVDAQTAHAEAVRIRSLIEGARQAGLVRAALLIAGIAAGIVVLVVAVVLLRRRRRGTRPAAATDGTGAAGDIVPGDALIGSPGGAPVEATVVAPPDDDSTEAAAARIALAGVAAAQAEAAGQGRHAASQAALEASVALPPASAVEPAEKPADDAPGAAPDPGIATAAQVPRPPRFVEPPTAYRALWPGDAPMPSRRPPAAPDDAPGPPTTDPGRGRSGA